ncbi:hypothetical protein MMC12_003539 [Toensbergia leucococca]|nr:hypothetical protein [Toensbergia leucococca]
MPSPSTPKRTPNRRGDNSSPKPKSVDAGKPLGPHDTNSVRDIVRQWQASGGGVITAPDIYAEDEEEINCQNGTPKSENRPNPLGSKSVSTGIESSGIPSKRSGRQSSRVDHEGEDRNRSGSAPRKRVVSDAHWRKKRSPPKGASSLATEQEAISKKKRPDDGIRVKPVYVSTSDAKRKKDASRDTSRKGSMSNDDGIRVYRTPPSSRRHTEHRRPHPDDEAESGSEKNIDVERASSKSAPSPPKKNDIVKGRSRPTPEKSPRLETTTANEETRRRKSSHQKDGILEKSPRSAQGGFSETRGSAKSHKSNILTHVFDESKKMFAKPELVPISAPRIPSIETWLSEMPDPFVDAEEPLIEIPLPLKSTSNRIEVMPKEPIPDDPNKIWETLDSKDSTRRSHIGSRRRRRIPSSALYEDNPFPADLNLETPLSGSPEGSVSASKLIDLVNDMPQPSPPLLKRRGAKRDYVSPIHKQPATSPLKGQFVEKDDISTISSADTISSVEPCSPNRILRPPGLNVKRPFPSTGRHKLSTIASVETFKTRESTAPPSISEASEATAQPPQNFHDETEAEARDCFDPDSLDRRPSKSRLAKHADLISILSLPRAGNKSIQSARSIRTNRSRLATATIEDVMKELATDESKYMRELRTLVDGVIPVLLTCVLSKSDSAIAAGLFRPSGNAHNDPNFTRPIVDMGIALERLKTLHRRVPQQDSDALLTWAQGAQKVYTEYLKAWRMGFQDVVVNLAPAAEDGENKGLDEGLPRNKDGDVVNGDGERVDVAFLLKRPLVRLKYLAKTLKGINFVKPSVEADALATKYQNLVIDARHRSNEERARLEDEAAASIDTTRARDPRTLGPLTGVSIDKTRRVRARDHFNLAFQHSSGQCVDCRVELLLRDDFSVQGSGGDLLICEVDGTGRWLLLPPVQSGRVSARNGDLKSEIVIMIRGLQGNGLEWQELLSLRTEDEQTGFEWVQMLGLTPIPPKITRTQSFIARHGRKRSSLIPTASGLALPVTPTTPGKSRTPSPREIEIPIGEQARGASKTWTDSPAPDGTNVSPAPSPPRERARLQKRPIENLPFTPAKPMPDQQSEGSDIYTLPSQRSDGDVQSFEVVETPRSFDEAMSLTGSTPSSGLRRSKAWRHSKHIEGLSTSPKSARGSYYDSEIQMSATGTKEFHDPNLPATASPIAQGSLSPEPPEQGVIRSSKPLLENREDKNRPTYHRSKSSVPSRDLPHIAKVRRESPPATLINETDQESEWPSTLEGEQPHKPSKLTKRRPVEPTPKPPDIVTSPTHRSPSPVQLKGSHTPVLPSASAVKTRRRSSSPLKHEYEPSTASESDTDSDNSTVEHNEATSVSDSSDDEELEDGDAPTPLLPLGALQRFPKVSPQGSLYSLPNGTLSPSQSPSQAPYRSVPIQPAKASKTIACIFSWSESGSWQSLHADECSIIITPGLIEAYMMSAAHSESKPLASSTPVLDLDAFSDLASNLTSSKEDQHERPLVALELTPLVPLRRGTALDISIRSPPTPNSQITSGNNIMFRSRNPEECEALYALINHSRINNPTYIALQNARGPFNQGSSFAASMDRRASIRAGGSRSSSWFGSWGGSSGYRASSAPTPSIAPSESSIGSMSSAFSALRRFGKGSGGGLFNIARSTISSRIGSGSNSIYTSSDNSSGSGASSPLPPLDSSKAAPIGLSNAKIRLYTRETASRWRDMGSARLTIMRPTNVASPSEGLSPRLSGTAHLGGNEKRILINGKTKGEILLDVCLGESCFERVARTGIALSVWEDVVGPNGEVGVVGAVGGVGGGRARVYMIQMKSEAETAYTFSIVGKLRY